MITTGAMLYARRYVLQKLPRRLPMLETSSYKFWTGDVISSVSYGSDADISFCDCTVKVCDQHQLPSLAMIKVFKDLVNLDKRRQSQ